MRRLPGKNIKGKLLADLSFCRIMAVEGEKIEWKKKILTMRSY